MIVSLPIKNCLPLFFFGVVRPQVPLPPLPLTFLPVLPTDTFYVNAWRIWLLQKTILRISIFWGGFFLLSGSNFVQEGSIQEDAVNKTLNVAHFWPTCQDLATLHPLSFSLSLSRKAAKQKKEKKEVTLPCPFHSFPEKVQKKVSDTGFSVGTTT